MPMVAMTMENCGWPISRRITTTSSRKPKMIMNTTVSRKPSQKLSPKPAISPKAMNAPTIIRSPCAKFTISVAL